MPGRARVPGKVSEGWMMPLCPVLAPGPLPIGFYKLSHLMVPLRSLKGRCLPIEFSQLLAPLSQ